MAYFLIEATNNDNYNNNINNNIIRIQLIDGLCRLSWRKLYTGNFTFVAECDLHGESQIVTTTTVNNVLHEHMDEAAVNAGTHEQSGGPGKAKRHIYTHICINR